MCSSGKTQTPVFPMIKFQPPQSALLQASDELRPRNNSSRGKELGGLALLDDGHWSWITGTGSRHRRGKGVGLSQPRKKLCLQKSKMKRNELPITQNPLNRAVQTFHVQQTNDLRPRGNGITDRKAESGECEQVHFLEARISWISWIKPNTF